MTEKAKIYISVSSNRGPDWRFVLSIQRAVAFAAQNGLTCLLDPHVGDSLISRARQDALADYLASEYDDFGYFLTIDDDINVPTEMIYHLYERQKDIVGGFYRLKQTEPLMAIRTITGERPNVSYFREVIANQECIQVKYLSTGSMMIKREVFFKLIEANPELKYMQNLTGRVQYALYDPFIYNMEYLSEDWALCQRALDAGYKIYVDGRVLCGHVGKAEFRIEGV